MKAIDLQTELDQLEEEARELSGREYLVATNEGTFSAVEARRAIGTGDPRFANCRVFRTPDGGERISGSAIEDAPGRMSWAEPDELKADRLRLSIVRSRIRKIRREHSELW